MWSCFLLLCGMLVWHCSERAGVEEIQLPRVASPVLRFSGDGHEREISRTSFNTYPCDEEMLHHDTCSKRVLRSLSAVVRADGDFDLRGIHEFAADHSGFSACDVTARRTRACGRRQAAADQCGIHAAAADRLPDDERKSVARGVCVRGQEFAATDPTGSHVDVAFDLFTSGTNEGAAMQSVQLQCLYFATTTQPQMDGNAWAATRTSFDGEIRCFHASGTFGAGCMLLCAELTRECQRGEPHTRGCMSLAAASALNRCGVTAAGTCGRISCAAAVFVISRRGGTAADMRGCTPFAAALVLNRCGATAADHLHLFQHHDTTDH